MKEIRPLREEVVKIEQQVQQWLKDVVIGLNLCPFAAKPERNKQIKTFVSLADNEEGLLEDILGELMLLEQTEVSDLETTLVVVPNMLEDFMDYNFFIDWVEALIKQNDWEGIYQSRHSTQITALVVQSQKTQKISTKSFSLPYLPPYSRRKYGASAKALPESGSDPR